MPKSAKKTFVIVDGHALLHRAWHALPPLTTKSGQVIHGAYGFTTIMLGALKKFSPDYMAVTFDLKGPTFRHEQYVDYKATREKKPDELYAQVKPVKLILAAMRIPVFTAEGYEADDVIGTISRLANEQDRSVETIIVTGDLDTLQLVDDRTKVYTLRKGMSDTVLYDTDAVKERYGLKPSQLVDYKALRGDPSDNIPGVKGIGEKTGSELISEFGSIATLYASLDKDDKRAQALKPAVREKLLANRDNAFLALDLCRIRRDAPVDFKVSACAFVPATREQLTPLFTELEFMKLLNQFPSEKGLPAEVKVAKIEATEKTRSLFDATAAVEKNAPGTDAGAGTETPANLVRVDDAKALASALEKISKSREVAFRSVDGALGLADATTVYMVNAATIKKSAAALEKFFAGAHAANIQMVCHDLKAEMKLVPGLDTHCFDLMIASYLLHSGERRHALGAILAYERGVPLDETERDAATALAAELPHFIPMYKGFSAELKEQKLTALMDDIETPLAEVLCHMEQTGIAIDEPYFKKLSKELATEIASLTESIHKTAGGEFNINSPTQLKEVLFDKLGISSEGLKKTSKNKTLSTAASELEKLQDAHPIIKEILRYRELTKLLSTYVDSIPPLATEGRVHAEFNQTVAATGRLSSANPNMQNIPTPETPYGKRVRNGFVASKGFTLLAADYSQIELRIAAHIAGEKHMIRAFRDGEDIHYRTAVEMFGEKEAASQRRIAKVINFGILYGMGPNALAIAADISFAEAKEYVAQYFALHQGIARYMEETKQKVARDGFVETLFGRKRFFRNVKFMNPRERAEAERQAINMPVQGTNADMIKLAMVRLEKFIAEKYPGDAGANSGPVRMLIQVHDELVFEVRKDLVTAFAAEVQPIMTEVVKLAVPVAVNVATGQRWGEMKTMQ